MKKDLSLTLLFAFCCSLFGCSSTGKSLNNSSAVAPEQDIEGVTWFWHEVGHQTTFGYAGRKPVECSDESCLEALSRPDVFKIKEVDFDYSKLGEFIKEILTKEGFITGFIAKGDSFMFIQTMPVSLGKTHLSSIHVSVVGRQYELIVDVVEVLIDKKSAKQKVERPTETTKKLSEKIAGYIKTYVEENREPEYSDIRKVSEFEYQLPPRLLRKILKDLNIVARQVRIVPSFKDGRSIGFKLFSIRSESLFAYMGIKSGDIITAINDISVDSPESALKAYKTVVDVSNSKISFDIIRQGEKIQLTYKLI